jgi:hypothetical protein
MVDPAPTNSTRAGLPRRLVYQVGPGRGMRSTPEPLPRRLQRRLDAVEPRAAYWIVNDVAFSQPPMLAIPPPFTIDWTYDTHGSVGETLGSQ